MPLQSKRFDETLQILHSRRAISADTVVAFSAGKDALVVLDMCKRVFRNVYPSFMYFVPHLKCVDLELAKAEARWNVKIRQYPHWGIHKLLRNRMYFHSWQGVNQALPKEYKLNDIYKVAMKDAGCVQLATGAKRTDSLWRRRSMSTGTLDEVFYPLAGWSKFDVLAYLKMRDIPNPSSSNRNATGIDLATPSILWLHDNFHDDYLRVLEYFPLAEAIVYRRTFYGIT
jgi:3'-phosphoadenosine 5'-phosphosulfate sulfotransferase (PAPS reductase)/FAD synthetase